MIVFLFFYQKFFIKQKVFSINQQHPTDFISKPTQIFVSHFPKPILPLKKKKILHKQYPKAKSKHLQKKKKKIQQNPSENLQKNQTQSI